MDSYLPPQLLAFQQDEDKKAPNKILELDVGEIEVETEGPEKSPKSVALTLRVKDGKFVVRPQNLWDRLSESARTELQHLLIEEYNNSQKPQTGTPVIGAAFRRLFAETEKIFDLHRRHEIDVKDMRKAVPNLRKICYLSPQDIETKGKVKNLWSVCPADWPAGVEHVDPNNPGTEPDGTKRKKPEKKALQFMLNWLLNKYEGQRDDFARMVDSAASSGVIEKIREAANFVNVPDLTANVEKLIQDIFMATPGSGEEEALLAEVKRDIMAEIDRAVTSTNCQQVIDQGHFMSQLSMHYDKYANRNQVQDDMNVGQQVEIAENPQPQDVFVDGNFYMDESSPYGMVDANVLGSFTDSLAAGVAYEVQGTEIEQEQLDAVYRLLEENHLEHIIDGGDAMPMIKQEPAAFLDVLDSQQDSGVIPVMIEGMEL